MKFRLWAVTSVVVGSLVASAAAEDVILGVSFPIEELSFSEYHLDRLDVRDFRFGGANWESIETSPGVFDWSVFDRQIAWALDNNLSAMITIASKAPVWACDPGKESDNGCVPRNMSDFERFVDELVNHLAEQRELFSVLPLHAVQFGNEWPRGGNYPGPVTDYVKQMNIVYAAFKARFPRVQVVLGGLGSGQLNEVAFCEGYVDTYGQANRENFCSKEAYLAFTDRIEYVFENARYDIVDQHLYWKVEEWPAWIDALKNEIIPARRSGVPVIVSEFGGPNKLHEPRNEPYQAQRIVEYLDTVLTLDIERAYFFKLVESRNGTYGFSGLIDREKYREADANPEKLTYWRFKDYSSARDGIAPDTQITSPQPGSPLYASDPITFSATAVDPADGELAPRVLWTSDLDGVLGRGDSIVSNLSVGTHRITATVTNSGGIRGYDLMTISTLNRAPEAEDQSFNALTDTPVLVTLEFEDDGVPGPYSTIITAQPRHGSLEEQGLGVYLYTPDAGYWGPDSFFWKADDGQQYSERAEASIEVNLVPVANPQMRQTLRGEPVVITLDYDDDFGPGPYSFTLAEQPQHGTVEEQRVGVFKYTPDPTYSGTDSFTWYVNDGWVDSNTAVASFAMNAVPVAHDQEVVTSRDGSVLISLDFVDDGLPGPYTVTITRQPDRGALREVGLGVYRYTPDDSFLNHDDFAWKVNDGWKTSNKAIVTIRDE